MSELQLVDMNVDFSHAVKNMYHFDTPTVSSLNNISILQWKWKSSEISFTVEGNSLSMEIVSWRGRNINKHTHTHTHTHNWIQNGKG